ncbi:copper resistance B precursor [Parvibaculum lavamentivorans DS-1]|jgi:copper resistance protein B|uniref:Copper resistance B n=1 Tax=Parvibaculum lavamentivorans (strain DS-1 / DSM 13023 / NCIMB 13966) TaxID=402881 RepID=A7HPY7_PARL1|nr:copper resistance protein B [Parvibaculum lavamentivorans]ABS61970.1 copper resistance B precursor [Parvibaculum lavamentivorans DS-1]
MKNTLALALVLAVGAASASHAREAMPDDHGPDLFNMIKLEADYADAHDGLWNWNLDGWVGGDVDRLWIRSEGEIADGDVEKAEAQIFYGRNVHPFWDLLLGIRQDFEPDSETYLAAGAVGLAPYFFETEATAFLSTEGDLSARFEQGFDLPITQKLIAEPHVELNVFAQDVPERGIGAGFSSIEAGLQLRYEVVRKFAPYVDLVWERELGETASRARASGEDVEDTTLRVGVRAWF